jgi:hypothetical protein
LPDEFDLTLTAGAHAVSAVITAPSAPRFVYVLAHGAGAGMRHPFLAGVASSLAARQVATLRYNFPYMEVGRNRVDSPPVAFATVRAAVAACSQQLPALPIIAGGKSFGGRMTSGAQAEEPMAGVAGLAFLGFPLHPPGRPGVDRAAHLQHVDVPMLFLQGARDEFASLDLLRDLIQSLGERATLELIPGADHSFKAPKSAGLSAAQVMERLADTLVAWGARQAGV